ncbi:hypothetical protein [Aliiroseovarius sp. F47248L]|uniref:hypothetical protein n=1 Tax=Aliiroseovarius sp. F47248L TaxID=2926420 RepID=UPI001FF17F41|nr:hypothetical protein [Aliiroseovarius sp. F47248L]MCK0139302.1 hypothetical protein [Aliiroseovarius sp. F47248L]
MRFLVMISIWLIAFSEEALAGIHRTRCAEPSNENQPIEFVIEVINNSQFRFTVSHMGNFFQLRVVAWRIDGSIERFYVSPGQSRSGIYLLNNPITKVTC